MPAVEGINGHRAAVEVGEDRDVTPVAPQLGLRSVGRAGAVHDLDAG